mgnify:CR=1 FL=1
MGQCVHIVNVHLLKQVNGTHIHMEVDLDNGKRIRTHGIQNVSVQRDHSFISNICTSWVIVENSTMQNAHTQPF